MGEVREFNYENPLETAFACLDGRYSRPVFGTPGGDAGEFILALYIYEGLLPKGRKLSQESIDSFFVNYLQWMK
jgi:hypothetical protein